MMGNDSFRLDEFVEVPDGYLWDDTALDNGRAFVQGGVYGKNENPWEDLWFYTNPIFIEVSNLDYAR